MWPRRDHLLRPHPTSGIVGVRVHWSDPRTLNLSDSTHNRPLFRRFEKGEEDPWVTSTRSTSKSAISWQTTRRIVVFLARGGTQQSLVPDQGSAATSGMNPLRPSHAPPRDQTNEVSTEESLFRISRRRTRRHIAAVSVRGQNSIAAARTTSDIEMTVASWATYERYNLLLGNRT